MATGMTADRGRMSRRTGLRFVLVAALAGALCGTAVSQTATAADATEEAAARGVLVGRLRRARGRVLERTRGQGTQGRWRARHDPVSDRNRPRHKTRRRGHQRLLRATAGTDTSMDHRSPAVGAGPSVVCPRAVRTRVAHSRWHLRQPRAAASVGRVREVPRHGRRPSRSACRCRHGRQHGERLSPHDRPFVGLAGLKALGRGGRRAAEGTR